VDYLITDKVDVSYQHYAKENEITLILAEE